MITKECNAEKKCCLYTSDFHLEMILLPYIKNRLEESEFVIFTQNDLSKTMKILLDRVNIDKFQKERILNLNWESDDEIKIDYVRKIVNKNKEINIIIKGDKDYNKNINNDIKNLINKNIHIIDCFCYDDNELDITKIKEKYSTVLNTVKL